MGQALDILAKRAGQQVIVVEAIKLLESNLRWKCDSIWVTDAPEEVQTERLVRKRGMSRDDALQRIRSQPAQKDKLSAAKVIIHNTGSYDDLWKQVTEAWKSVSSAPETATAVKAGELIISRGRPRDSQKIAELINRLSRGKRTLNADDVMEAFDDKAYMLQSRCSYPLPAALPLP